MNKHDLKQLLVHAIQTNMQDDTIYALMEIALNSKQERVKDRFPELADTCAADTPISDFQCIDFNNNKFSGFIEAIKETRALTGASLKDAKYFCDVLKHSLYFGNTKLTNC